MPFDRKPLENRLLVAGAFGTALLLLVLSVSYLGLLKTGLERFENQWSPTRTVTERPRSFIFQNGSRPVRDSGSTAANRPEPPR